MRNCCCCYTWSISCFLTHSLCCFSSCSLKYCIQSQKSQHLLSVCPSFRSPRHPIDFSMSNCSIDPYQIHLRHRRLGIISFALSVVDSSPCRRDESRGVQHFRKSNSTTAEQCVGSSQSFIKTTKCITNWHLYTLPSDLDGSLSEIFHRARYSSVLPSLSSTPIHQRFLNDEFISRRRRRKASSLIGSLDLEQTFRLVVGRKWNHCV
jgi:hypothetical protein